MNAATLRTVLEETLNAGDRVAIGFTSRSFFVSEINAVEIAPIEGAPDDNLFTVTGMIYDTDHSRQATPETIYFQASDVVSLARPAQTEG